MQEIVFLVALLATALGLATFIVVIFWKVARYFIPKEIVEDFDETAPSLFACQQNGGQHKPGESGHCVICGDPLPQKGTFWKWLCDLGKKPDRSIITEEHREWVMARILKDKIEQRSFHPTQLMVMYILETGLSPFKHDHDCREALVFLAENGCNPRKFEIVFEEEDQ